MLRAAARPSRREGEDDQALCRASLPERPRAEHGRAQARGCTWTLRQSCASTASSLRALPSWWARPGGRLIFHACSRSQSSLACLTAFPRRSRCSWRDRALFELAYACGLRASELVSLDVGDIDHDAEQLRVQGKGDRTRLLPIGEQAQTALAAYLLRGRERLRKGEQEPALFLSRSGRRLDSGDVRRRLRGWALPPVRPATYIRMRCVTASRPTCSTGVRTCARYRSCSATRASPRPRFTLAWSPPVCEARMLAATHGPDQGDEHPG